MLDRWRQEQKLRDDENLQMLQQGVNLSSEEVQRVQIENLVFHKP